MGNRALHSDFRLIIKHALNSRANQDLVPALFRGSTRVLGKIRNDGPMGTARYNQPQKFIDSSGERFRVNFYFLGVQKGKVARALGINRL